MSDPMSFTDWYQSKIDKFTDKSEELSKRKKELTAQLVELEALKKSVATELVEAYHELNNYKSMLRDMPKH